MSSLMSPLARIWAAFAPDSRCAADIKHVNIKNYERKVGIPHNVTAAVDVNITGPW